MSEPTNAPPQLGPTQKKKTPRLPLSFVFLLVMTAGYAVYATDRTVLSAVLAPMSASLSLSDPQVGLLSAAQYIGVTCVVFASGYLSDRYGRWPVMICGVVVFSAFTWLIAFSSNFTEAFTFRLVSGFGEGAFWPVAMASVANCFKGRRGLTLGIFYAGFDVGSIAGTLIGGAAYTAYSNNWRPAFLFAPLLGILVVAGALAARKRLASAGQGVTGMRLGADTFALLRQRNVLVVMAFALLATWASVWQVTFLPYFFYKVMHFTVLSSALFTALVTLSGSCGKVIFGGFSDLVNRKRILVLVSFLTFLSYAVFFLSPQFVIAFSGALAMGFFSGSIFPIMQAFMTENSGGRYGTSLGLSTSSQSVATIFSPIIAASLFTFGISKVLALNAMVPIALATVVALLMKGRPSAAAKVSETPTVHTP